MKNKLKEAVQHAATDLIETAEDALAEDLQAGGVRLQAAIRDRIGGMVSQVSRSLEERSARFVGVNEDEMLTYVADRRSINGVGALLIGLLLLVLLPSSISWLAAFAFLGAIVQFLLGYVLQAKVDIPEGFEGVVCQFGQPLTEKAHRGRNWLFSIRKFVPYLVSTRDQVVDAFNANFTGDYVMVGFGKQIVFRVVDHGKFVSNTTPSGVMKLLSLYASYISLRMITSITDARVKFTGRDHLQNVIDALNGYLSETCGIQVIRVNMPQAQNSVLEDLEKIRTLLKEIDSLVQTKTVRIEAAIKTVEQTIRQLRLESRNEALELQQAGIRLETSLGEATNEQLQQLLMEARRTLDSKLAELRRAIADFQANVEKSRSLKQSLSGLRSTWDLRMARLKQRVMIGLMPREVRVLGVDGIGMGVGMGLGADMVRRLVASPEGKKPE